MPIEQAAASWRPVVVLAPSEDSRRLSREVARLVDSIHAKVSPSELETRAIAPTFTMQPGEWAAHTRSYMLVRSINAIVRMPPALIQVDDSCGDPMEGFNGSVETRFVYSRRKSYRRQYVTLSRSTLYYSRSENQPAGDDSKRSGTHAVDLHSVQFVRWHCWSEDEPYAIELSSTRRTWVFAMATIQACRLFLRMICTHVDASAIDFRLRAVLQSAEATVDIRLQVVPVHSVGDIVAQIFTTFETDTRMQLRQGYKIPGYRDFILDHTRPLNAHLHVRDWLLADKRQLRLSLIHKSQIYETVSGRTCLPGFFWDREVDEIKTQSHQVQDNVSDDISENTVEGQDEIDADQVSKSDALGDVLLEGEELKSLRRDVITRPFSSLAAHQESQVWTHRELFQDLPEALPRILLCVDWSNLVQVEKAVRLLPKWAKPRHPVAWIELLRPEFIHQSVREFAVKKVDEMPDATLSLVLPQLVQALKFESSCTTPLALLLIKRALLSPMQIGFKLFWLLKVETHERQYRELCGTVLNAYVDVCNPTTRSIFKTQDELFADGGVFQRVWEAVNEKAASGYEEMNRALVDELSALKDTLPCVFSLPIDARTAVCGLIVDECRVLDAPDCALLLAVKNADDTDNELTSIVFKCGKDVQQECVLAQLIRVVNEILRHDGVEASMKPARCVATGSRTVVLEVVRFAASVADIHAGRGMLHRCKDPRVLDWITTSNPGSRTIQNPDRVDLNKALSQLVRSSAGWLAVMAFLRVSEPSDYNTMIRRDGRLGYVGLRFLSGQKDRQDEEQSIEMPLPALTKEIAEAIRDDPHKGIRHFVRLYRASLRTLQHHQGLIMSLLEIMVEGKMTLLQPVVRVPVKSSRAQEDEDGVEAMVESISSDLDIPYYAPWRCTIFAHLS